MKAPETKAGEKFREELKRHGCQVVKLHGNLYQPGLPDFLVGRADGALLMVEMKFTRELSMTVGEARKLLRPGQRRFFHDWEHCPVYIVVANSIGQAALVKGFADPDERLAWHTYGEITREIGV